MTSCRTFTIKSLPKVSLVASWSSKATTATARKYPGHPVAMLFSCFWRSHGSVPCPHSLGQHSHSHLILFSHVKSKLLSKVWQAQGGPNIIVPGLSSVTTGTCFASLGVLSSAQTSGNCINSLSRMFSPSRRLCNLHSS